MMTQIVACLMIQRRRIRSGIVCDEHRSAAQSCQISAHIVIEKHADFLR